MKQILFLFCVLLSASLIGSGRSLAAPNAAPPPSGTWKTLTTTLKDGRKVTQIQMRALSPLTQADGTTVPIILAIECRGTESTAAIALKNTQLTARTRMTRLTVQIDEEKPRRVRFHRSANKQALLIRSNKEAINFMRALIDKQSLMVTAPFSQPLITGAIFKLGDIKTALYPIAAQCKWKL